MFGFINLNKPTGFTSHDCVAKLRKLLNTKKVGHGGTLDPAATGVLPIAIGKATRLLQFLPESKSYRARIRLGVTTTTDDLEGEVIQSAAEVDLEASQIITSLDNFIGTIEQTPPIYSAIKKDGRKLYELARKGEQIEIESRTVNIAKIELIEIDRTNNYEIEVDIDCGAGTYIRAIARDLGQQLGVGGTLASLVRTQSCGMQLHDSVTFAEIETHLQQQTFTLIEPSVALNHLDAVYLSDRDSQLWSQGQLVDLDKARSNSDLNSKPDYLATYQNNVFLGISILYERNEVLKIKPKIVCIQQ